MSEDEQIKELRGEIEKLKKQLVPKYPKVSSIQASSFLKEELDSYRVVTIKESFEDIIWRIINENGELQTKIKELEEQLKEKVE